MRFVSSGGNSASSLSAQCQLESADKIEQANGTGAVRDTANTIGAVNESRDRTGAENSTLRAESNNRILSGTAGSNVGNCDFSSRGVEESNSGARLTGWEAERAIWLETERTRRIQAQAKPESCQVDSDIAVSLDSIVSGVTAVASIIEDEPADDTEYAREHVDSKALAKELRKKEELGMHMG
ncbi:hypothetical protein [Ruminococcus sp.]|uniref:hypothetical protein n=1 Tax=Ruminococcus sp. TaxID=41978 RepID=UPI0025F498E0|nr:hypothetical protein [Ruminococcus sp.]